MNQENAKDFLPFVQALAEGKDLIVNCGTEMADSWEVYTDDMGSLDSFPIKSIRIKPEVTYIPFDTTEELINYWCHIRFDDYKPYNTELEMPLIWVKAKKSNTKFLITGFEAETNWEGGCVYLDGLFYSMIDMFEDFTFLDGSPIGKIKE